MSERHGIRGFALVTVLIGSASAITAGAVAAQSESPAASPPVPAKALTVVMGIPFESANDIVTVVLPQELGYFAAEGLEPDFQFTTGASNVQLLTAGQADIGFGTVSEAIIARSEEAPIKAVYNILTTNATAIAVPEDSPIQKPEDLKGKTIGTATVGTGRYFDGRAMLTAAGLDPDNDVSWVSVGIGAQALQALQAGQVDAIVLWNAAYADMENQGARLRYFTFPFQDDLFSIVWEASDDLIANDPQAITGFGRAIAKATAFAMANPEASVDIFLEAHPELIPAGTSTEKAAADALNILKRNLADMPVYSGAAGYGGFTEEGWQTAVDYYTQLGLVEKPLTDVTGLMVPDEFVAAYNDFDKDAIEEEAKSYQ